MSASQQAIVAAAAAGTLPNLADFDSTAVLPSLDLGSGQLQQALYPTVAGQPAGTVLGLATARLRAQASGTCLRFKVRGAVCACVCRPLRAALACSADTHHQPATACAWLWLRRTACNMPSAVCQRPSPHSPHLANPLSGTGTSTRHAAMHPHTMPAPSCRSSASAAPCGSTA